MEYVLVTTIIIAAVEAIKAAADRNWRVVAIICGAGLTGAVLGAFGVEGIGVWQGLALGVGASGVVTVAKKV